MNKIINGPRTLIAQSDKDLDELYHRYASSHNLSDVALFILYVLWDNGEGCTQSDICELWSYTRQTVNSSLKKLEKDGYICLAAVPGNKKSKSIIFTDTGKKLTNQIIAPFISAENAAFSAMEEQELTLLVKLTQKRVSLLRREIEKIN